jgi:hypothetical protein
VVHSSSDAASHAALVDPVASRKHVLSWSRPAAADSMRFHVMILRQSLVNLALSVVCKHGTLDLVQFNMDVSLNAFIHIEDDLSPQYRLPSYLFRMMKIRALPFKLMPSDHRCLVQEDMQTRKVQTCPNLKAGRV